MAEQVKTNGKDHTNHKFQPTEMDRVKAFMSGVQVTSIALIGVLKRKTAVGIITEETGKAIFEDVGKELTAAIEALPDGPAPQPEQPELPLEAK